MRSYKELEVWKESRQLVKLTYEATATFPKTETYGLVAQIRRAVISVPSNIAEGCGRHHRKESLQFCHISRGSLYELETQILVASDLLYINDVKLKSLEKQLRICLRLLNGFIRFLETQINTK